MKYSFDEQGGFYAYSEVLQWAAYAYPSSTYGEMARKNPSQVLAWMSNDKLVEEDLAMASRSQAVRESLNRMLAKAMKARLLLVA